MTTWSSQPTPEGLHRSAVLLASLGTEVAARVLSHMDEPHVEALIAAMSHLGHVPVTEREAVADEFGRRLEEDPDGFVAGPEYARHLLEQAVGPERAGQMLGGQRSLEPAPPSLEEILANTSPRSLAALVADEHPQLIALLTSQLPVDRAAELLAGLPADLQGPVTARLAEMETPAPLALEHLERCLAEKLQGEPVLEETEPDAAPRRVADILGRMRRSLENLVLASLEQQSPALARRVNRFRFTFENLLQLEPRTLQRVLRDVEADTLRLAMQGMDPEQHEIILGNMSERAGARLKEELESAPPAQLGDVEAAQQTMVAVARSLQERGEVQFVIGAEAAEEVEIG